MDARLSAPSRSWRFFLVTGVRRDVAMSATIAWPLGPQAESWVEMKAARSRRAIIFFTKPWITKNLRPTQDESVDAGKSNYCWLNFPDDCSHAFSAAQS